MSQALPLKIDVFNHILPARYKKLLDETAPGHLQQSQNNRFPTLWDLDYRFRIMDKCGVQQVLTLCRPPIEEVINDPQKALDLTSLGNDEMAEIVARYPDRFPAAIAAVALNTVDSSLKELERAIVDLKFKGVQIYSHVNHKPLDSPEFRPLFGMMAKYDLPVFIHPTTGITYRDYMSETASKYTVDGTFGWPYETTVAMNRLVFSGLLEQFPNLKIITHHGGGMVSFYEQRIMVFHSAVKTGAGEELKKGLTKAPIEYYKMMYADTALYGNAPALMLACSFFGVDHLLFATDFPFGGLLGERATKQTIAAIEEMDISDVDKRKIFEDNARRLMHLTI